MTADTDGRLAFLARTVDLLWPDAPDRASMVVLPTSATPRVLVPRRARRAAAAAVLRYTAQQSRRDRAAGAVLAAAVVGGYARTRPPVRAAVPEHGAESIDDHLGAVLGHRVVSSLALTRDRPNRKPVLQVFDPRGHTVAFAKIGVTDLAAGLVRGEAVALQRLAGAGLRSCEVPRVLSSTEWKGHPVLVTSALATGVPIAADATDLAAAMREIAGVTSCAGTGPTAEYVASLRARAAAGRVDGARGTLDQWCEVFDHLVRTRDLERLSFGAWHGDWTSWNCSRHSGRVLVWDWERFTDTAPLGFDILHYVLNDTVRPERGGFREAAATLVTRAAHLLAPWGIAADDARTTALLYVLDIALRYLRDDARSTDSGGHVEQWALPTVRDNLELLR